MALRRISLMALFGMLIGSTGRAEPQLLNYVAAIVNDSIITFQEVETYTAQAVDLLRRTYGREPEVFQRKRIETLSDGLEALLERQLILDEFKSLGGVLPDSVIDDEIKDRIREQFGDRVRLTQTLKAQGMTYEAYRQRAREKIIVDYMRQKNVPSSAIVISPQKVERYYQTNLADFKLDQQVKLRMIVLSRGAAVTADDLKKLAVEIVSKVEEGASFAEMATVYSDGSQRTQGGDWGWVESSKLNKGLSEIAFALNAGQHSPPIALAKDAGGYWIYLYNAQGELTSARHYTSTDVFIDEKKFDPPSTAPAPVPPNEFYLMLVEEKRPARVKSLQEVQDEIEKTLSVQERERLRKKWIERLRNKSFVRYF